MDMLSVQFNNFISRHKAGLACSRSFPYRSDHGKVAADAGYDDSRKDIGKNKVKYRACYNRSDPRPYGGVGKSSWLFQGAQILLDLPGLLILMVLIPVFLIRLIHFL